MLFINNFASTVRTNAKNEIRLVNELTKVPGIDIDTIRTQWGEISRNGRGSKELTVSFEWHGFFVKTENTPQCTTEVFMNHTRIGEIYWDAYTGHHTSRYTDNSLSSLQKYIVDTLGKVFFKVSEKRTLIKMQNVLSINGCKIMAEKAEITYICEDGRKGVVISKDPFGQVIDELGSPHLDFIKKNFIIKY